MIRHARIQDARSIHKLLLDYANQGQLLGRSLADIYDAIRDFYVCEEDGEILGIGALAICWEDLAEVRSLAVASGQQGKGVGKRIVESCLAEARELGLKRVFALTYQPDFLKKWDFTISKSRNCHKRFGASVSTVSSSRTVTNSLLQ